MCCDVMQTGARQHYVIVTSIEPARKSIVDGAELKTSTLRWTMRSYRTTGDSHARAAEYGSWRGASRRQADPQTSRKRGTKARFALAELTRPVNSASGNARPSSTRPVLTGNGNRSPVKSGR